MRSLIPAVVILSTASALCLAQADPGPVEGAREFEIWAAGGHSVPGGAVRTGVFNAGLRYGWILTGPHLPSIFRGRFEYAVDAVPVFLVFQPANTAYGVSFSPLGLKWNFERHGRLSPYLELGGGLLFTDHMVPAFTSRVNFTPSAALGTHILGAKCNWRLEVRYLHISNAGLTRINPGLNTVEFRLGVGKFFGGHP